MSELHVVYSFPLRVGVCGIGMTAWHQVKGLVRQGVKVHLYAGSCEKEIDGLNGLRQTLVPVGIKLPIRLLGIDRTAALHDQIVAKAVKRIHEKAPIDVIHCWPLGSLETLRVAKDLGILGVLERPNVHTRYAYEVVDREYNKLGLKASKTNSHTYRPNRLRREEKEYDMADLLLCPSSFVAQTCMTQGIAKDKIAYHRYGFAPDKFALPTTDTRHDDQSFNMAFVGRCEPRKGLHYALDAWLAAEASKSGTFYICGNYVEGYRELLARKLAHPSVKEVGFLNDVSSLVQKCHALILPSIEEGSALVTYEARACGCVLLVSEASGAHCHNMHDALVHQAGDVDSLREHIDMLASDRSLYQRLRNNSLAGLDGLTWKNAAETLVDIYRQTLNSSSR